MKILHPTDFSDCAEEARAVATRLAKALNAELLLLHVSVEAPLFGEGLMGRQDVRGVFEVQRRWAEGALEERAAEVRGAGVPALTRVVVGAPHAEIVRVAAEASADLIVMGTHGRGGVERFLLGSVTDRVMRTAPCPVLTVREGKGAPTTGRD